MPRCLALVLAAAALTTGGGCRPSDSVMGVTTLSLQPPSRYERHERREGATLAVEAVTDGELLTFLFAEDVLARGVLPVLVVLRNENPAGRFALDPAGARLIIGQQDQSLSQSDAQAVGHSHSKGTAQMAQVAEASLTSGALVAPVMPLIILPATLISAGVFGAGAGDYHRIEAINACLRDKALAPRSVGPGKTYGGFVYFALPDPKDIGGIRSLTITVRNLDTGQDILFEFPNPVTSPPPR